MWIQLLAMAFFHSRMQPVGMHHRSDHRRPKVTGRSQRSHDLVLRHQHNHSYYLRYSSFPFPFHYANDILLLTSSYFVNLSRIRNFLVQAKWNLPVFACYVTVFILHIYWICLYRTVWLYHKTSKLAYMVWHCFICNLTCFCRFDYVLHYHWLQFFWSPQKWSLFIHKSIQLLEWRPLYFPCINHKCSFWCSSSLTFSARWVLFNTSKLPLS